MNSGGLREFRFAFTVKVRLALPCEKVEECL